MSDLHEGELDKVREDLALKQTQAAELEKYLDGRQQKITQLFSHFTRNRQKDRQNRDDDPREYLFN